MDAELLAPLYAEFPALPEKDAVKLLGDLLRPVIQDAISRAYKRRAELLKRLPLSNGDTDALRKELRELPLPALREAYALLDLWRTPAARYYWLAGSTLAEARAALDEVACTAADLLGAVTQWRSHWEPLLSAAHAEGMKIWLDQEYRNNPHHPGDNWPTKLTLLPPTNQEPKEVARQRRREEQRRIEAAEREEWEARRAEREAANAAD